MMCLAGALMHQKNAAMRWVYHIFLISGAIAVIILGLHLTGLSTKNNTYPDEVVWPRRRLAEDHRNVNQHQYKPQRKKVFLNGMSLFDGEKNQQGDKTSPPKYHGDDVSSAPPESKSSNRINLMKLLEDPDQQKAIDPLRTNDNDDASLPTKQLDIIPRVEYLGVTVDAGHYYFPLPWLKRLIIYLHRLRFNLIHFRLSDDENFAVRLKSYPELAFSMTSQLYTPEELQEVVMFAKKYNITIVPELQLLSRVASWGGIPGLVANCPEFVCERGRGIPFNVDHPDLKTIIKEVIREVLDIFDMPPLLHLGDGKLFLATQCFKQAMKTDEDSELNVEEISERLESLLKDILKELNYPEGNVIRMNNLDRGDRSGNQTAGGLEHIWFIGNRFKLGMTNAKKNNKTVLAGLDFSDNHVDSNLDIYQNALELQNSLEPKGILAGSWLLGPEQWLKSNVVGRLVAVAMGAANLHFDNSNKNASELEMFQSAYQSACRELLVGKSARMCDLEGRIAKYQSDFRSEFMNQKLQWRHDTCDRLTRQEQAPAFQVNVPHRKGTARHGNAYFWETFGKPLHIETRSTNKGGLQLDSSTESIQKLLHAGGNSSAAQQIKKGIIFDLVNSPVFPKRIETLMKQYLAPLGCFDFLQLRIADDYGFAFGMEVQPKIGFSVLGVGLPISDFRSLIRTADNLGIEIIPEISVTSNAGGWAKVGYLRKCPQVLCQKGKGVANDIQDPKFLPVVYSVLRELLQVFSHSSYISLGSDEREESRACFEESGHVGEQLPHGKFERKLTKLVVDMLGIPTNKILRWENSEHVRYPDRTGDITQYRSSVEHHYALPNVRREEPFWVTLDILEESNLYAIYYRARSLVHLSPNGVMGEVRLIQKGDWKARSVGLRLIAFAVGIHSVGTTSLLSPEELSKKVAAICHAANFNKNAADGVEDCDTAVLALSDHSLDKPDEPIQYDVETDLFREQMCSALTYEKKARVMKEDNIISGVVLDKSTLSTS